MPRYVLVLLGVIVILIGVVAFQQWKFKREMTRQLDAFIEATNTEILSIRQEKYSIMSEFDSYKAVEARRRREQDSVIQSYQKEIKFLQRSVNWLKQDRDEIIKELDIIKSTTELPEL